MVHLSRRALLGSVGALLGATSGCLGLATRSEFGPADWPLPRSDPGQTSYSPTPGPVEAVDVAWSRSIPTDIAGLYRQLLLADGTLYALVADGDGESFSEQFSLHGIDCDTGRTQFRVPNVSRLFAVAGTRIYDNGISLGGGPSQDGWDVLGINPDDSIAPRRWASTAPTPYMTIRSPVPAQTVVDGTWYYCHSQDPVAIVAVDVDDGRQTWRRRFDTSGAPSLAAIDGRIVIAVANDDSSTMRVLDPDDGRTQQKRSVSGVHQVTGRDSTVYVETSQHATAPKLSAYDVEQLEQLWETDVAPADWAHLGSAVGPDRALVAVGRDAETADGNVSDEIRLLAFDRHSGTQRWRQNGSFYSPRIARSSVSVSIGDRTGYVATGDGELLAVSMDDGAVRWQTNVDGFGSVSQPVLGDGRLYLWIQNKGLVALEEP